jgi:hypothetical protein
MAERPRSILATRRRCGTGWLSAAGGIEVPRRSFSPVSLLHLAGKTKTGPATVAAPLSRAPTENPITECTLPRACNFSHCVWEEVHPPWTNPSMAAAAVAGSRCWVAWKPSFPTPRGPRQIRTNHPKSTSLGWPMRHYASSSTEGRPPIDRSGSPFHRRSERRWERGPRLAAASMRRRGRGGELLELRLLACLGLAELPPRRQRQRQRHHCHCALSMAG